MICSVSNDGIQWTLHFGSDSVTIALNDLEQKSEKKVGHHSELETENPCGKQHKKCCLNGGECYYPVCEDILGCYCAWLYGLQRCEK